MPFGNVYSLVNSISCASASTLLQITAPTTSSFQLLRASLTQRGGTTSAQEQIAWVRKSVAATGLVTATIGTVNGTLFKLRPNDPNPSLSLGSGATGWFPVVTSEGTDSDIPVQEGFNVLNGWAYVPVPEDRIVVSSGGSIALKFLVTPSAVQAWRIYASLIELV